VLARVITMASDLGCAGLGLAVSRSCRAPVDRELSGLARKHRPAAAGPLILTAGQPDQSRPAARSSQ